MSLSIAVAQATLALRDKLLDALAEDQGWLLTGLPPAVQVQPYSVIAGQGLTLWLVSVAPDTQTAQALRPAPARARRTSQPYELTLLVTAESDMPLFAHLMVSAALDALTSSPVLQLPPPPRPTDRDIERNLKAGPGAASAPLKLIIEPVKPSEFSFARLPALMIRAGPLMVAPPAVVPIR